MRYFWCIFDAVLRHFHCILGAFRVFSVHCWVIFGIFLGYFGIFWGIFEVLLGVLLGVFWGCFFPQVIFVSFRYILITQANTGYYRLLHVLWNTKGY